MMTCFKKNMMKTLLDVDAMMIYVNLTLEEILEICGLTVLGTTTCLMMTICLMIPFVELEAHCT